ncbi:MAG: hypothetical protein K0R54_1673 [Clostridiaceae bacterium]|jgi:drug/metabolite transporter (DMT)-like permease|nr:hypothetical protein [Clostridiaceae bacterium]
MVKYFAVAIFSGMLSSFAQILLKKSSEKKAKNLLHEYFNIKVIAAYGITFICMMLTIIAFKGIPYKYGSVLEALTYLYIMILSKLFIGEKITKNRLYGNVLIVIGVIIFSLGK